MNPPPPESLLYDIELLQVPGIGSVTARLLIRHFGTAQAVFSARKRQLLLLDGIGEVTANEIVQHQPNLSRATAIVETCAKNDIQIITSQHPQYPSRLQNIPDAPLLLYYKGNTTLQPARTVAIVGTRTPSERGIALTEQLVEQLAPYQTTIVSGLAYGIDITAHKHCITQQVPTLAVLGSGLGHIYPAAHKKVAHQITQHGGILSQFPLHAQPDREHFPQRNRIIAALADALIVVETATSGGSIITANIAAEYQKPIFALPGRTTDPLSKGCNQLIKKGTAYLLDDVLDLVKTLQWNTSQTTKPKAVQQSLFNDLNPDELQLVEALRTHPRIDIDTLTFQLNMSHGQLATLLLQLEMKNIVRALPGKRFELLL